MTMGRFGLSFACRDDPKGSIAMTESQDAFFANPRDPFAVVLGANEIASAIAVRLCWEGFRVVMSHDPFPPVIRRGMAFYDALFDDRAEVDGIVGERAETVLEIVGAFRARGRVVVTPLPLTELIVMRAPTAVVDARMQKRQVTPDLRGVARLAIGVGPNFSVRHNCDVAIETHPARTGAIIETGATRASDGVARPLGAAGKERFVYSAGEGVWRTPLDVGQRVFSGYPIGNLDGVQLRAPMDGYLRGIARDGIVAPAGVKLAEVDPRGRAAAWTGTDERGRAIASAVFAAIKKFSARAHAMAAPATFH
jgi:xanthine dehydrogenase accessory factor